VKIALASPRHRRYLGRARSLVPGPRTLNFRIRHVRIHRERVDGAQRLGPMASTSETRLEPGMIARDISSPTIDARFRATGSLALLAASLLLLIGP
jgi:hypothetical protein